MPPEIQLAGGLIQTPSRMARTIQEGDFLFIAKLLLNCGLYFKLTHYRIVRRLDMHATLKSDIGKGERASHSKERTRMARCRYQDGYLFIRGCKRKMWVARWREDVIQP